MCIIILGISLNLITIMYSPDNVKLTNRISKTLAYMMGRIKVLVNTVHKQECRTN